MQIPVADAASQKKSRIDWEAALTTPLTELPAWKALAAHYEKVGQNLDLRALFADSDRFNRFNVELKDDHEDGLCILADFSKNLITDETLKLLVELVKEAGVEEAKEAMFEGYPVNTTEGRAVLHTALRSCGTSNAAIPLRDHSGVVVETDVRDAVKKELGAMRRISEAVRSGKWRGHGGQRIANIVNIGIGGSDLGPAMVVGALKGSFAAGAEHLQFHFVANVDGSSFVELLKGLDPEQTLFLVVSKTFTTAETLANARSARAWLLNHYKLEDESARSAACSKHFLAVTASPERAACEFGIKADEGVVQFWDWVGGRFSLWSGVGLAIALAIGADNFEELLAGARVADEHFRSAPFDRNIPVLMGALGVWYGGLCGFRTQAVLPYDQHLARFPAYLQQAEMESNGKSVDRLGRPVSGPTAPVIWGEPGTCGQHAFFQLLHQGTQVVPCDFLVGLNPLVAKDGSLGVDVEHLHRMLVANCFAQSEALMLGKSIEQVQAEYANGSASLPSTITASKLLPQKMFPGNRPSTTFCYRRLSPRTLGALIALYEHKIFVQGILWRINSFDQWGVELGKQLASVVEKELLPSGNKSASDEPRHDSSTTGLIAYYHRSAQ